MRGTNVQNAGVTNVVNTQDSQELRGGGKGAEEAQRAGASSFLGIKNNKKRFGNDQDHMVSKSGGAPSPSTRRRTACSSSRRRTCQRGTPCTRTALSVVSAIRHTPCPHTSPPRKRGGSRTCAPPGAAPNRVQPALHRYPDPRGGRYESKSSASPIWTVDSHSRSRINAICALEPSKPRPTKRRQPSMRRTSPGVEKQKGLRLQFNCRLSTLVYHSAHGISNISHNIRRLFPADRLPLAGRQSTPWLGAGYGRW
eukprot:1190250-Prorocentrum_minimum.AAC.9